MRYIYNYKEYIIEIISELSSSKICSNKYILVYVIGGILTVRREESEHKYEEEATLLINPNTNIEVSTSDKGIVGIVSFEKKEVSRFLQDNVPAFNCDSEVYANDKYDELRNILKKILDGAITFPKDKLDIRMTILFYKMLEMLLKYFLRETFKDNITKKSDKNKEKIASYIESNYMNELTLKKVAKEVFLSYHYLSHDFNKMFGINFNEYLNKIRLLHITEQMHYTNKTLTEIAIDNGYNSAAVFNRIFRKAYKVTPGEYKKQIRQGVLLDKYRDEGQIQSISKTDNIEQSRFTLDYSINAEADQGMVFKNPMNEMINIGYAADLLQAKLQKHILILHQELGFRYVRMWNIFCEQMELRNKNETENMNFDKIDQILDFLVGNEIHPFIEFGDKPRNITNQAVNNIKYAISIQNEMGTPIFRKKSEFKAVLEKFMLHVIERYGINEVTEWKYEFWNDYYRPERQQGGEKVSFFEAFDIACEVIKSLLPNAIVGGGGMPCEMYSEKFFEEWSLHTNPDFISAIYFPYSVLNDRADIQYEAAINHFSHLLDQVSQKMKKFNIKCLVYVTEWNSSIYSRNYQNDSCMQAAYCMSSAFKIIGKADMVGYWCGSDLYTSSNDTVAEIYGGAGLLTKNEIKKPVYYAFEFLNKMEKYLVYKDENTIITSNRNGLYTILCQNYQTMNYRYYIQAGEQWDIQKYLSNSVEDINKYLRFNLNHMECGKYRCTILRMSPNRGGLLEEWKNLGFQNQLNHEDIDYLRKKCVPFMERKYIQVEEDKTLKLHIEIETQEIVCIKLRKCQ